MIADQTLVSNWHVQEDELVQTELSHGEHTMLKGSALEQFEFGATLRLSKHNAEALPSLGILVQYSEQEKLYVFLFKQQERWALAVETTGVAPVVNRVIALPETFDPAEWHTLHLIQDQEQSHIHLDGTKVLMISEANRAAQPGLITVNAAAEFSRVWQKGSNA
ncbi:hypothetical protein [Dictyobacter kobayashii]|uniref:3-keto-disaccharide hydrolase domain-containing protein n=1 Tax=Dictyobacter kobayashii TaxID=2014872 RepID=A0A402ALG9_9CHLR|nr:hypothetical protein [Dictyobacter kobayashii]GCE19981.1 hypothetical protein KDK_37810 [Dictyobacter kobayashii]